MFIVQRIEAAHFYSCCTDFYDTIKRLSRLIKAVW